MNIKITRKFKMLNNISAVINTYNAAKHLEKVLEALKDFDEIIVCDMYSNDETIKIAENFNCKIFYHKKISYVEPARNYAIQQAKNEWVLVVDADEIITFELKQYLENFIKVNKTFSAISIPRKNYFLGHFMRSAYPDYCLRFFKKKAVFYTNKIHSPPEIDGIVFKIDKKNKDLAIVHLADESVSEIAHKNNLYSNEELTKRSGKKIGFLKLIFSPFWWFFKFYILKKGFLDGKAGFVFAALKAQYKFLTIAKIFENNSKL